MNRRVCTLLTGVAALALPLLACGPFARIASPITPAPGGGGTLPPIDLPPAVPSNVPDQCHQPSLPHPARR